jgi:hypothetical protein
MGKSWCRFLELFAVFCQGELRLATVIEGFKHTGRNEGDSLRAEGSNSDAFLGEPRGFLASRQLNAFLEAMWRRNMLSRLDCLAGVCFTAAIVSFSLGTRVAAQEWTTVNKDYSSQQDVDLGQITPQNVSGLKESCEVRNGRLMARHARPNSSCLTRKRRKNGDRNCSNENTVDGAMGGPLGFVFGQT